MVVPDDFDERLGRWLSERGTVDSAGLERARRLSVGGTERLHAVLMKLGFVSERDMAEALSVLLELPLVGRQDYPDAPVLDGRLKPAFLKQSKLLPLAETSDGLVLAMADPLDDFALRAVELYTRGSVLPRVAIPADLEAAFERLYGEGRSAMDEIIGDLDALDAAGADEEAERLRDQASEAPIIKLVNTMIGNAVGDLASDVHIEPFENRLRVRYRVDGVLRDVESPPRSQAAAIISRIKIMAKLNIAERRLPQDGRIKLTIRGKQIDLRVSTVPTLYGESVVMRVLDRDAGVLDLPELGFSDDNAQVYLEVLAKPHGIVLVTGPTGSGKTTTLYASLLRLNTPERKILTVEDPIEYQLDGVNQIQVKPQIDLTFANVLRHIVRQDPDVIMIGEIRDLETAQIAVQAALTGHLVLSTLHTNSAAATVTRLVDMGLEAFLLTSTVSGVVAQRLVRTLCTACREPYEAPAELLTQLGLTRIANETPVTFFRARGCEACRHTGYRGRSSVSEILVFSEPVRDLVLQRAEALEIERAARAAGMKTMYEDAIQKAISGVTSLEEVLRATSDA